jgi:hypothetical protein
LHLRSPHRGGGGPRPARGRAPWRTTRRPTAAGEALPCSGCAAAGSAVHVLVRALPMRPCHAGLPRAEMEESEKGGWRQRGQCRSSIRGRELVVANPLPDRHPPPRPRRADPGHRRHARCVGGSRGEGGAGAKICPRPLIRAATADWRREEGAAAADWTFPRWRRREPAPARPRPGAVQGGAPQDPGAARLNQRRGTSACADGEREERGRRAPARASGEREGRGMWAPPAACRLAGVGFRERKREREWVRVGGGRWGRKRGGEYDEWVPCVGSLDE